MFDTLVESTRGRNGGKTGRFFALTTMIYGLALASLAIGTIVGFSPVLAEEYRLEAMLAPPPVPSGPPPMARMQRISAQPARATVFASPVRPAVDVLPASRINDTQPVYFGPTVAGAPSNAGPFVGGSGIPGGKANDIAPPPPMPKVTPQPVEEPKRQGPVQVSKGVLQGKAIRKVKPEYSSIARQIRASGAVQVLVLISEEGRVIEATAIDGHPVLRPIAVAAARGWVFEPTTLSEVPVKVQGVLTFNFILQ